MRLEERDGKKGNIVNRFNLIRMTAQIVCVILVKKVIFVLQIVKTQSNFIEIGFVN